MILKSIVKIGLASYFLAAGLYGFSVSVIGAETGMARCNAPDPVCSASASVFRISSFDPIGSAVMIGPEVLITNRHVIADHTKAMVYLPNGRIVQASVVPTSYSGDLVLLKVKGLGSLKALETSTPHQNSKLFSIGTEIHTKQVRVYSSGRVILLPAEGKPLARLHHSANSRPGNSGGALVDISGRLVGIVTSGGDGFYEAIPATEFQSLRLLSGPQYEEESRVIGMAYRRCTNALEMSRLGPKSNQNSSETNLIEDCAKSRNRQLFDLAGQTLGRAGQVDDAIAMFERALTQDPHAINSRIGLIVTLHLARRYGKAVPHLKKLIKLFPTNLRILQLSIQAGKLGENLNLARGALELLEQHYPRLAPNFKRFLEDIPRQ